MVSVASVLAGIWSAVFGVPARVTVLVVVRVCCSGTRVMVTGGVRNAIPAKIPDSDADVIRTSIASKTIRFDGFFFGAGGIGYVSSTVTVEGSSTGSLTT